VGKEYDIEKHHDAHYVAIAIDEKGTSWEETVSKSE